MRQLAGIAGTGRVGVKGLEADVVCGRSGFEAEISFGWIFKTRIGHERSGVLSRLGLPLGQRFLAGKNLLLFRRVPIEVRAELITLLLM
jgi:hypothetical protein